jgi:hypothetical protein
MRASIANPTRFSSTTRFPDRGRIRPVFHTEAGLLENASLRRAFQPPGRGCPRTTARFFIGFSSGAGVVRDSTSDDSSLGTASATLQVQNFHWPRPRRKISVIFSCPRKAGASVKMSDSGWESAGAASAPNISSARPLTSKVLFEKGVLSCGGLVGKRLLHVTVSFHIMDCLSASPFPSED